MQQQQQARGKEFKVEHSDSATPWHCYCRLSLLGRPPATLAVPHPVLPGSTWPACLPPTQVATPQDSPHHIFTASAAAVLNLQASPLSTHHWVPPVPAAGTYNMTAAAAAVPPPAHQLLARVLLSVRIPCHVNAYHSANHSASCITGAGPSRFLSQPASSSLPTFLPPSPSAPLCAGFESWKHYANTPGAGTLHLLLNIHQQHPAPPPHPASPQPLPPAPPPTTMKSAAAAAAALLCLAALLASAPANAGYTTGAGGVPSE